MPGDEGKWGNEGDQATSFDDERTRPHAHTQLLAYTQYTESERAPSRR